MVFAYKKYQVEVLNTNDEVKEVLLVRAWSEAGAVEKVHKKVMGTQDNSYRLKQL